MQLRRFTYSLSQVLHHLGNCSTLIAARSLRLRYSQLAEELELELKLAVMSHLHHNQIALSVPRDEDRLIHSLGQVRDLVRLVP